MAKPKNIRFYGATKAQKLASRSHDSFRLEYDGVSGAVRHEYQVRENGQSGTISSGVPVQFPTTNEVYSMRIRALMPMGNYSDWSDYFVSMTRPAPNTLTRFPYDLQEWGVVLEWTRPGVGYNYDVELHRVNAGGTWHMSFEMSADPRFVDTGYVLNQSNKYFSLISTGPPPVSLPYNESRNKSFPSNTVNVTGPISHVTPTVQKVLQGNINLGEMVLREMMTGD